MSKIAFLGEEKLSLMFKNFGIDIFTIENREEVIKKINEVIKMNYEIILITEENAGNLGDFLEKRTETFPVIFVLPSSCYSGFGINLISNVVEKAVGINILSKEKGQ
jgi:vacuolar-type H+-ATPase subunit F/Vma7